MITSSSLALACSLFCSSNSALDAFSLERSCKRRRERGGEGKRGGEGERGGEGKRRERGGEGKRGGEGRGRGEGS